MDRRAYTQELLSIYGSIPEARRAEFVRVFVEQEKNPVVAFGWSVWLGPLGADRFYCNQVVLGVLKLVTFGGFCVWALVDLFLIPGTARDISIAAARRLRDSFG